jgi:DNA polymerase-1
METNKKNLLLIDGSSFLYRAYYGLSPLHSRDGKQIQAVYGFVRMIKKIIDSFKPENMVLVWDSKGKTERHEIFADYKATRQAPPSDLFEQKELIIQFADMIALKEIVMPGVEADDLIHSLAKKFSHEYNVIIISSDKDLYQLLGDSISIYDPFKMRLVDEREFESEKGFHVQKLPFFYALVGDSSDNIPGVKGIGKTGATELVRQFESLDDLYANLDKVTKARTKNALENDRENAFLSENLFKLRYHDLDVSLADLLFDATNWKNAYPLFEQLNFKSLLTDSKKKKNPQQMSFLETQERKPSHNFKTVLTHDDLAAVVKKIEDAKTFALDTETTGLHPLEDCMVGLSVCVKEGEAFYIPVAHNDPRIQITKEDVIAAFKPMLENPEYKKILHNAKFDMLVFLGQGIDLRGLYFDTMIAASLSVEDWQSVGLKQLSQAVLNEPMLTFDMVVSHSGVKTFADVPIDLASEYAAADAHQTLKLYHYFKPRLKEKGLMSLYETIENEVINVLTTMEATGIAVDLGVLSEIGKDVGIELASIERAIKELVGSETINLNSPKQIEEVLFYQLMLPPQKKTKSGYSTDQEVLEKLATMHPVPKLIIRHRELSKLKSTYIDAMPAYVNQTTGKIHTSYSQTRVATGRLSSSEPNLQNIPVNSGFGIRSAFKASEGHVYLSADYSQIELRVLAYLSQDPVLRQAFLEDRDIHTQTTSRLFDVPFDQVTSEQRGIGKRINFSVLYGMTPYGLSQDLKIPLSDAKKYIDKFFAEYVLVTEWMKQVIENVKKFGYVATHWGRRRYVPGINERNKSLYEAACRAAINTQAQGTAAELMKKGMIDLHKQLRLEGLESKILLQIHDELLIDVPEHELERVQTITKNLLENVVSWNVPLKVSTRVGADWQEVTK